MRTKYYGQGFTNASIPDTKNKPTPKKKLIDRVTKLFALADSTLHEAEATNARKMAVELLTKHNLSLNQTEVDKQEHITISSIIGTRLFEYDKTLNQILAQFTGVFIYISKEKDNRQVFNYIGTPSNLQAFQYILQIVTQQRTASFTTWTSSLDFQDNPDRFGWKNGFSLGVYEKCRELTDQMKEKVEEKGLVVINESLAAKNSMENSILLSTGNRGNQRTTSVGFEAGKVVSFNKGVSQTRTKTLRIEN